MQTNGPTRSDDGGGSIRDRLVRSTALLIAVIVVLVALFWSHSDQRLIRQEKLASAEAVAVTAANAFMNELDDHNWNQVRIAVQDLVRDHSHFAYIIVHDSRSANRIVATSEPAATDAYYPDFVRADVTAAALQQRDNPMAMETWALRDIAVAGQVRIQAGERVLEVAAPIHLASGTYLGSLRVGVSLKAVDAAIVEVLKTIIGIALLALAFGLLASYVNARRLSEPIVQLRLDASVIADGDLTHRATVQGAEEIVALADSFNHMTSALSRSIAQLRGTLTSFERFVPQKFLEVIAPDGVEHIEVGVSTSRRLTVLFSDIRGYTSISEGMTPQELFELLNDYLAAMGEAIDAHQGFIDKYIGDAIMALFDDESTDEAVQAALAMRAALAAFNQRRVDEGRPVIDIGIGLHAGDVVMGAVGYASRIDSTVLGDPVNVASRVEGLTKAYGCPILVTDEVVKGLERPAAFTLRKVEDAVAVKGRDVPIALFEVIDQSS